MQLSSRMIIILSLTGIILAFACYASLKLLGNNRDGTNTTDLDTATQPESADLLAQPDFPIELPINAFLIPRDVDGTIVTTAYIQDKEVRTLFERPFETVITTEAVPTIEVLIVPTAETAAPEALQVIVPTPTFIPLPTVEVPAQPIQTTGNGIIQIAYVVQAGDTLYSIASAQSTSVALMAEYGIDATDIVPGNVINIPVANSQYCGGYHAYIVKEGDTAYSIGRRFNTSHTVIQQINNLSADFAIQIGQVLCIP